MQKELTLRGIISTLSRSVREYKKMSLMTPVLVIGEVVIECIIPFITAQLITVFPAPLCIAVSRSFFIRALP